MALEAGLWFPYGRSKRPEVTAGTTFEAVLRGERVSTTRFRQRPGHEAWARVGPGDLVRFHERQDRIARPLVVRVTSIASIDLLSCDTAALEAWILAEGWSPDKGRALGREMGKALWVRHELVWPLVTPPVRAPVQMALF